MLLPGQSEACHGGMEPGFHRSQWDLQLICHLDVAEPLEIRQEQDFALQFGKLIDDLLHDVVVLACIEGIRGSGDIHLHEVYKCWPVLLTYAG